MSSLYQQIVRDIEDEETKKEIISSLAFFGSKITKNNVEELREKVNKKFKSRNVPRKLSDEQIESIIEFSIPKVPATLDVISEDNNRQIKEFIRGELKERKIVITTDNIEKLKNEIKETYYRSLVSPGDSVGVEVAMSFGQPLTQMNLDTFHSAGTSSDLGSGVKSLQELFNVSENRKKNLTTIHFKDKNLTREEIHVQGKALKGVSIKSLLEYSEIKYYNSRNELYKSNDGWWYDNYLSLFPPESELMEVIMDVKNLSEILVQNVNKYHTDQDIENAYITHDGKLSVLYSPLVTTPASIASDIGDANVLYTRPYIEMDRFLRLKFNITKCYNLGISMSDIIASLKDETILCIASPLSIGIIDIHPNEEYIQETMENFIKQGSSKTGFVSFASCKRRTKTIKTEIDFHEQDITQSKILFLTAIIETCLDDIFIKGIKGINNIIPMSENVINAIKTKRVLDIDLLLKYNKKNLWYMGINYMKLKYTGIPYEKIIGLCNNANIKIIQDNIFENDSFSKHPHLIVESLNDPKNAISEKFNNADKYVKEQVKKISTSSGETEYNLPDYPDIYRNAFYNYAYAEGEKIVRKLMRHTKLDNKLILPNNPNEIYEIFGVESARLYMVREYVHLIESSDSYVTPVNIELLVDYQTGMGFLTPIHAIGASKQGTSSLSAATFNDPVGAFQKAATVGKVDKINSISSCIMAGKKCINGSGLSKIVYNEEQESIFDELPREFDKEEEFCEQRYVIAETAEDKAVDINIEKLLEEETKEESKFSKENVPTIVPAMEAPDFLSEDKDEEPEVEQQPIQIEEEQRSLIPVVEEDDDSDFDIPDAPSEVGELKDF